MFAEAARAAQRSAATVRRLFEAGKLPVRLSAAEAGLNSGLWQLGRQMLADEAAHSEERFKPSARHFVLHCSVLP